LEADRVLRVTRPTHRQQKYKILDTNRYARIDHPEAVARGMLHDLLIKLGERHVRALLYPLFVALKSPKVDRKSAAETIMNN
jgi:phosphatidylinositol kinase/protein kinase (PI-3  family)